MSNQTFTVTGITTKDGVSKVRWTQDLTRRAKMFQKSEYDDVRLVTLPNPMTKLEALAFLKTHLEFQSPLDQETIDEARTYREMVAAKAAGTYVMKKRGRPRKNVVTAEMLVQIVKETV